MPQAGVVNRFHEAVALRALTAWHVKNPAP